MSLLLGCMTNTYKTVAMNLMILAIDLAASVMIAPGLEARLGFANDNGAVVRCSAN